MATWKVGVALVVLTISLPVLLRAVQATRTNITLLTSPGVKLSQLQETQRYACLEALLRRLVPMGSDVVDQGAPGLDYQRIAEEMTPGYHFVSEPRKAAYVVTMTANGPCLGAGVDVSRVDR